MVILIVICEQYIRLRTWLLKRFHLALETKLLALDFVVVGSDRDDTSDEPLNPKRHQNVQKYPCNDPGSIVVKRCAISSLEGQ